MCVPQNASPVERIRSTDTRMYRADIRSEQFSVETQRTLAHTQHNFG